MDTWYQATVSQRNETGKVTTLFSNFYTGTLGDLWFEVNLENANVKSAWLHGPDGTDHALARSGSTWGLGRNHGSEAALDAVFPDGFYRLDVVLTNGP